MLWEVWTLNHRMQQFFHRLENKLLGHEITAINESYLGTLCNYCQHVPPSILSGGRRRRKSM